MSESMEAYLVANDLAPVGAVFVGMDDRHTLLRVGSVQHDGLLAVLVQGTAWLVRLDAAPEWRSGDRPTRPTTQSSC